MYNHGSGLLAPQACWSFMISRHLTKARVALVRGASGQTHGCCSFYKFTKPAGMAAASGA